MTAYRTIEQIKASILNANRKNQESTQTLFDNGQISEAIYNKVMASLGRSGQNAAK